MKHTVTLTDDEVRAMQFQANNGYTITLHLSRERFVELTARAVQYGEHLQTRMKSPLFRWIREKLTAKGEASL